MMFLTTSSILPHFCVLFLLFAEKHYFVVTFAQQIHIMVSITWHTKDPPPPKQPFCHMYLVVPRAHGI